VKILDGAGAQLPASINVCDNAPQVFTASVQATNATYQWFLNNVAIPGANTASYTVTQPGVYTIKVTIPGNACPGEATVTVVGGTSPTVQNATLTACYTAGNATFNLPSAQGSISTTRELHSLIMPTRRMPMPEMQIQFQILQRIKVQVDRQCMFW
jgi:copper(I)-binding protein